MTNLPTDWLGLTALVFLLGLKHGFDPDHLVAIDGLTRSSARARPGVSRWAGLFFSLGHGVVVTLVALVVAAAASHWQAPSSLEHLGAWLSIGVLLVLGMANLLLALRTPSGEIVSTVAVKGRWVVGRLALPSHPMMIAAIGAGFAVSFDTISNAVLFSITGVGIAGRPFAVLLGIVFTLGMVLTDALNGLWVARIFSRADRRAAIASHLMSLAIALLSLALAALGLAKYTLPAIQGHADDWAPAASVAVFIIILMSYALASRLASGSRNAKSAA